MENILLDLVTRDEFIHIDPKKLEQEESFISEWNESEELEQQDNDNPVAEFLFDELRNRGLCIEELVFAPTGLIHPDNFYSQFALKANPALGQSVTQEDAIREIHKVINTGEYTPIDSGIMLTDYIEEFLGSKLEDFVIGNRGGEALNQDGSLYDVDYAVMVVFHLHELEELEPNLLYKHKNPKDKQKAIAAVIGFDLLSLEKEFKIPEIAYIREDGEEMHIIENFLCDEFGVEAITSDGNRIIKLGSIHPIILSKQGWTPENNRTLSAQDIGKQIEPELLEGYHFVGKIGNNGQMYIEKYRILQVYHIVNEED